MTRTPKVDKNGLRKGPWSKEEDDKLKAYIERYGHWNWREIPRFAGVSRCGKSCRLRWINYLRPNIKHGNFTEKEEDLIMEIHSKIGNKWAKMATELPGRSDNEIKNHWHTHLKKRPKNNQNDSKNMHHETNNQTNFINNLMESTDLGEHSKVEALRKSSTSEASFVSTHEYACVTPPLSTAAVAATSSSSFSSSVELTSPMSMASDSLISTDEYDAGNFWTDPLFADLDAVDMNVIMAPFDSDDFMWSTMDLDWQYHSQFLI